MTPEQFCYWLQGRAEMQPDNPPNTGEWKMIVDHLQTVFKKVTPTPKVDDHLKRMQDLNKTVALPAGGGWPHC